MASINDSAKPVPPFKERLPAEVQSTMSLSLGTSTSVALISASDLHSVLVEARTTQHRNLRGGTMPRYRLGLIPLAC